MTDKTTNMSPEWVQSLLTAYPCTKLESGNIRTCIARLSFPHLFKPQPPMEAGGKEKFTATLLFPVGADLSVLKQAAAECAIEKWPNAGKPGGPTLHTPFRKQDEKVQFAGYEVGGFFIVASGERKPPVVDAKTLPIVEEKSVYPGMWVMATLRAFAFDAKMKKGVSFGLQSIMKIADDVELGGGGSDPTKDFAGVAVGGISNEVDPSSLF